MGEESAAATLRTATAEDVAVLRDIFRRSSLSNVNDRAALLAAPDALEWSGDGIAAGCTLMAEDVDGRAVGFVTAIPCGEGRELDDLFVDPDAMRRGVATRLVTAVLEQAAHDGIPWIEVTANPHAAAFYGSAGFVEIGIVRTRFSSAPRLRRTTDITVTPRTR
jgi:GNAT superfamily N-acetyltransferase